LITDRFKAQVRLLLLGLVILDVILSSLCLFFLQTWFHIFQNAPYIDPQALLRRTGEKPGYRIPADIAFADIEPEDYDAIILSGGRAPEYLRNDPQLQKIVRHFVAHKRPIAALCHGSLILAAVDALRGCTVATYEALAPDIERAGGKFKNTEVVVEGNLVTSRTWMDLPFFMREFLRVLRASEKGVAAKG